MLIRSIELHFTIATLRSLIQKTEKNGDKGAYPIYHLTPPQKEKGSGPFCVITSEAW